MFRNRTIKRLEQMLEDGIQGNFRESGYNESRLSRLECRWRQFLENSSISRQSLEREKENIQGLISDISHQTRTPLSNIRLYGELLEERLKASGGEAEAALARQIVSQTERLEFLIQSLTKMSRLESNILMLQPSVQEICGLMENARQEILPKALAREIHVNIDCPHKISASYDKKWTSEALYNLLDNAVKYTQRGGEIHISVTRQEIFTKISIQDNGKGIALERQAEIFKRFYREPEVHEEPGIGIGLYLTRKILELQNGYIEVRSGEGEGSVFCLYLPERQERDVENHKTENITE